MNDKKEINLIIGANIKRERENAGFTQEKFSEMVGLGAKSLSAIERGTVGISLSSLKRICTVLSISSDALIFGESAVQGAGDLGDKLARLSPEQYEVAVKVMSALLEAFSL